MQAICIGSRLHLQHRHLQRALDALVQSVEAVLLSNQRTPGVQLVVQRTCKGPVALVGYMHRDLVERRQWISESEYKEGLTLAQLMPGPLAAQLAIYLGFVHYGVIGATVVGKPAATVMTSSPR